MDKKYKPHPPNFHNSSNDKWLLMLKAFLKKNGNEPFTKKSICDALDIPIEDWPNIYHAINTMNVRWRAVVEYGTRLNGEGLPEDGYYKLLEYYWQNYRSRPLQYDHKTEAYSSPIWERKQELDVQRIARHVKCVVTTATEAHQLREELGFPTSELLGNAKLLRAQVTNTAEKEFKHCSDCGSLIGPSFEFCPQCGATVHTGS